MESITRQTQFKAGWLYYLSSSYIGFIRDLYVCSKSGDFITAKFRQYPSCKASSYIAYGYHGEYQVIYKNVPFSRKSLQGRMRVDKFVAENPELFI